jgi:hypothetical protein
MKCLVDGCEQAGVTYGCCWDHRGTGQAERITWLEKTLNSPLLRVYRCHPGATVTCGICRNPIRPKDPHCALYTDRSFSPDMRLCGPCDKKHVKGQIA